MTIFHRLCLYVAIERHLNTPNIETHNERDSELRSMFCIANVCGS